MLIVNADDWGRDRLTTDRILDCVTAGAVSAVSAMVFAEDSERAAALALDRSIDVGLHLNFTSPFTAAAVPPALADDQRRIARYLRLHRYAQSLFNPALIACFEHVAAAQINEFRRLYGVDPVRIDGHHHMHLCANVLRQRLLPPGTIVRRNFSFQPGEKGMVNRAYRRFVDHRLARRHRLVDFLFSLAPIQPAPRLHRIVSLARHRVVELETHPAQRDEFGFLTTGQLFESTGDLRLALREASLSRPETVTCRNSSSAPMAYFMRRASCAARP